MSELQMNWEIVESADEEILADAIEDERPVCFRYFKEGEADWTPRVVSPYELRENLEGEPYLLSYDHSREDIRSFRLAGIEAIATAPWVEYRRPVDA